MQIGDQISWERTFTKEDIRAFARLSGDEGRHHLESDERGRLMAHGLLTATLPTKIGGDLNLIASEMVFRFHRPVFAGDSITCEVVVTEVLPETEFTRLGSRWICRNQHGKEVMTGEGRGIVRK